MIRFVIRLFKWSAILAFVTLVSLTLASPFFLYQRYNVEYPVAKLEFQKIGEQEYLALVRTGDFCNTREFKLFGDQWRLDASILKWKGLAVSLGFESKYRLDRLSGRYRNVEEQNSKENLAHQLAPVVWLDIFNHEALSGSAGRMVDTVFGSSAYLDIDTSKRYTVYMTEDALIAKARDIPQVDFNQEVATIEINNACARDPQLVELLVSKINRWAVNYL